MQNLKKEERCVDGLGCERHKVVQYSFIGKMDVMPRSGEERIVERAIKLQV